MIMQAHHHPNALVLRQITAKVFIALLLMLFVISSSFANRTYGPVQAKDFLIKIVNKSYPNSTLAKDQIMVAILRTNPEAFRGGNIHFLKQSVILNLPNENDIASIAKTEASALVAEHLVFFKKGKTGNFVNKPLLTTSTVDSSQPSSQAAEPASSTATLSTPATTSSVPTKIKIEIRKQQQTQDNKFKQVESLEKISTQQNKTLHSLDEQIRVLEDQLKQDSDDKKQASATNQTVSEEPAVEPAETKSNEDETAENAISSLQSILSEQKEETEQKKEPEQSEPATETKTEQLTEIAASNAKKTVHEAPLGKATSEGISATAVGTQNSSATTPPSENPNKIALLSAFVLGLFALGYFFLGRKRQQQTIPETRSFDTSPTDIATDTIVEIPKQDSLLNPVIKEQSSSQQGNSRVSTKNDVEDSEIKINMARAYMDMGYIDAAKESLEEVLEEGTTEQKDTAQQMLRML